jgi:hypothetical protein
MKMNPLSSLLYILWKISNSQKLKWANSFGFLLFLFVAILVFASIGFCLPGPNCPDKLPIAILRSLQLFVLNAQTDQAGSSHWAFLIPKFLAPLFSAGAVLKLLHRQVNKKITETIIKGTAGHKVVIGLSAIGRPLVSSLLETNTKQLIVAIDLDSEISDSRTFEAQVNNSSSDLILLEPHGRGALELMHLANYTCADSVYFCTASNLRNRDLMANLPDLSRSCITKFYSYEDQPEISTSTKQPGIVPFSVSQAAARMGVFFHSPFLLNEKGYLDCPRIIVIGSNQLAGYLLAEIANIWHSSMEIENNFNSKYPTGTSCKCSDNTKSNWESAPSELRAKLKVEIISRNAQSFASYLTDSSNIFANKTFVDSALELIPIHTAGCELIKSDLKTSSAKRTVVYIVEDSLDAAEESRRRIFVALANSSSQTETIIMTVDSLDNYTYQGLVQPFGFLGNHPTTEWITGESVDKLITGVHTTVWCQENEPNDTDKKQSLNGLRSFGSAVKSCGLTVHQFLDGSEDHGITAEIKEALALREHERWCREMLSNGYSWSIKRGQWERPALLNFDSEYLKKHNKDGTDCSSATSIYTYNLEQVQRWNTLLSNFQLTLRPDEKP